MSGCAANLGALSSVGKAPGWRPRGPFLFGTAALLGAVFRQLAMALALQTLVIKSDLDVLSTPRHVAERQRHSGSIMSDSISSNTACS